jgi:hypothetical protein
MALLRPAELKPNAYFAYLSLLYYMMTGTDWQAELEGSWLMTGEGGYWGTLMSWLFLVY